MNIRGPFFDSARRHSPKRWYLSYFVPKKNPDGTVILVEGRPVLERKRPYYRSQDDAQEDKPALLAQYASAGASSAGGVLTREMAAEFEQAKHLVPETSLVDIARFWRSHHPLSNVQRIRELTPIYLAAVLARLGPTAHYEDLKSRVGKILVAGFGDRIPETVTAHEAMAWLTAFPGNAKAGRTVLNLKQAACGFFNWLKEEGHTAQNPFGGIKRRRLPRIANKEIGFLSLDQAEAYLRACERYDPELVAHEIVQLFAGVRADDEMANFRGEWVLPQTEEVVIPADVAKTGRREVLNGLEDAFWAWWKVYGRAGLLRPANWHHRWMRVRVLALQGDRSDGLARWTARKLALSDEARAANNAWPWNGRRRTFVTYHVAKYQNADKTALIIRHRGDTYTLHNSYRGLGVTQRDGEQFFALRPKKVRAPELPPPAARQPSGIVKFRIAAAAQRMASQGVA